MRKGVLEVIESRPTHRSEMTKPTTGVGHTQEQGQEPVPVKGGYSPGQKSSGVPKEVAGDLADESTSTVKTGIPVSGKCPHGSERKHCVQCEITEKKLEGR